MMWRCSVVVLVGCGRVGFAPSGDSGAPTDDAGLECLAGYSPADGSCYRVVRDVGELAWAPAELACEADGAGAHLAVISSRAEATLVKNLVLGSADAYVGASDRISEGRFLTVQGMPVLDGWAAGQPDGGDVLDCVLVTDSGLADGSCNFPNDFVCEYDGIVVDPASY